MKATVRSTMDNKDYPDLLDKAIERGLTKLGVIIEGDAVTLAPVNMGRLKGAITYATKKKQSIPKVAGDAVSRPVTKWTLHVGANLEYAGHVEYGTRPHFPPIEAIADWAKQKGISEDAVFPIAKSISKKGTKAQPFLRPALDANRLRAQQVLQGEVRRTLQNGK